MSPQNPPNDTQSRIVATARELFHNRTYADVGVAEICTKAGVKKGSFYHFFPSKRDLTLAVLDDSFAQFKTKLLDDAFAASRPPMQRIQRLIESSSALQRQLYQQSGQVLGCPFGNIAAEQATQDETLRRKLVQLFKRMQNAIETALTDALALGERRNIDPAATANAMVAYLEGVLLLAKTQNDPALIERLLPSMLDIGVAPTPQPPRT